MSRRGGNNAVRGPTSALTSFLRDQGIDTRSVNTWGRRDQNYQEQSAEAGPSNVNDDDGSQASPSRTRSTTVDNGDDIDSDDLDGTRAVENTKKKKLTKAQLEKEKAKAKAEAKKRKRTQDDEDDSEDEYTAPSKGIKFVMPGIGSFDNCATCSKKFTVTRYTIPCNPPPGVLCHDCAKASGTDPFKKPSARKRKAPADRRKIVNFEEKEAVKNLSTICIEIIGKHIDAIDALGDIGSVNMNAISMIMAKHRKLTAENVQLFCDVRNTALTIHDATPLLPPALTTLASLNPNLRNLRLDFCGRMNDSVLHHYASHLKHLTRVELLGPFLVRTAGWISFIDTIGAQLEGFLIFQSPRLDVDCIKALAVKAETTLTELRLAEVGKLDDNWLPHIASFKNLSYLDLSYPASSLNDDAVIQLLSAIGNSLSHLDLSGNILLTDDVLVRGVAPYTLALKSLHMTSLELLSDKGVADFFNKCSSHPPLSTVNFSRNQNLSSEGLTALLAHSGIDVEDLNVNSWKEASIEALMSIGRSCPNLKTLDFGWCRNVDDFVIQAVLNACPKLSKLSCFGCNRVTEYCPKKHGVAIFGVEAHVARPDTVMGAS